MKASIYFNSSINMTYLSEDDHFFEMFQIYWYTYNEYDTTWDELINDKYIN